MKKKAASLPPLSFYAIRGGDGHVPLSAARGRRNPAIPVSSCVLRVAGAPPLYTTTLYQQTAVPVAAHWPSRRLSPLRAASSAFRTAGQRAHARPGAWPLCMYLDAHEHHLMNACETLLAL